MEDHATVLEESLRDSHLVGRIPVKNIWLLFLYASNLARFYGQHAGTVEESPDFPSLVARLLCYAVDRRLRRNLSRGYQTAEAVVPRVRGRIDLLKTFAGNLLDSGTIACRFEEFTLNTPRNRLVRAALEALSSRIGDRLLTHECARLAVALGRQGVAGAMPSRAELSADRIGRHDAEDLLMVTLAKLVYDLVLPTEDAGKYALTRVEKDAVLVRKLFEKAVGNFYRTELTPFGWTVHQGKNLSWQIEYLTPGSQALFPRMISDIVLENVVAAQRLIVDTKFTSVFGQSQYKEAILKSGHIYQLYTYLRSQEKMDDPLSLSSSGILLHPTIESDLDERVNVQGHEIRFVTVDLMQTPAEIIGQLRSLVLPKPMEH